MARIQMQGDKASNQADTSQAPAHPQKCLVSDDVRHMLDAMPHLIWMCKSGIGYANNALRSYIGQEQLQLSDLDWMKYLHPEDAEHMYNLWTNAQKNGAKN